MKHEFFRVIDPPTAYEVHCGAKEAVRNKELFLCSIAVAAYRDDECVSSGEDRRTKVKVSHVISYGFGHMREIAGSTEEGHTILIQADQSADMAMGTIEKTTE